MKKAKKWWIPPLLGAMLMAALVGVVWARPKSTDGVHYKMTIPGSAFHPNYDGIDWYADWGHMHVNSDWGDYTAAVPMPPGTWTVENLIFYVDDQMTDRRACVYLERLRVSGVSQTMASVCSPWGTTSGIQKYKTASISPSVLKDGHGAYLQLEIGSPDIEIWAVQIGYY